MASRYWVGNGGNWSNWASHWSTTSGGAPGAALPTIDDDVYFDANSFTLAGQTVTHDLLTYSRSINWTGALYNPTWAFTAWFETHVRESFALASGMTMSGPPTSIYLGIGGTVTTAGVTIPNWLVIGHYVNGFGYTLQDALTTTSYIDVPNGVFDTNGHDINCFAFRWGESFSSWSPGYPNIVRLNASTVTCSGFFAANTSDLVHFSLDAGASTIVLSGSNTPAFYSGNGRDLHNLRISRPAAAIYDTMSINNITVDTGCALSFSAGDTRTITTLTADGATLQSDTPGSPHTLYCTDGNITVTGATLRDSAATGGAVFRALNSVDAGGNSGWYFSGPNTNPVSYAVAVDWDGSGLLTETGFLLPWQTGDSPQPYEDVSGYVRSNPGIRTIRGRDQIRSLTPPMAGFASCDLDNQSRTFSPENSSSPLYGNLIPGRKVQIRAVYNDVTHYLFTGLLDDIPQHPERSRRTVSIPSLGTLSRLAGKRISTALYSSVTTGAALGYLLDAAGWPAADRVLDTGQTTLDWWWLQDEDAFTAAVTLMNTEGPGAALYEDGQGRIVFENRNYRMTTVRSKVPQATISDTGSEPLFSEPFSYNPGLKDIINVAEVTITTRSAAAETSVWQLGQTITLAPSETRRFVPSSSEPFTGAITPTAPTDYAITSGSLDSLTMDRTSGQSCTITMTAGPDGTVLTGLQLRAQPVTVDSTIIAANTVDASASIAKYGRRTYTSSIRPEIALTTAQDLVNAIVSRYQDPRPTVTLSVNNGSDARMIQVLTREISDRITVVEAQTSVDHDYWVERIGHQIDEAGRRHVVELGCEKVVGGDYFVIGTSVLGTGIIGY